MSLKHAKPLRFEVVESYCDSTDFHLPIGTIVDAWFESSDHNRRAAILFYDDQKFWGFLVVRRGETRCEPEHVGRGMLTRESVEQLIDKALAPTEYRGRSPLRR